MLPPLCSRKPDQVGGKHCTSSGPLIAECWPPAAVAWHWVSSKLWRQAVEGRRGLTASTRKPPTHPPPPLPLASRLVGVSCGSSGCAPRRSGLFLHPALLTPAPRTVNPQQTAVRRLPGCFGRGAPPVSAVTNSCEGQPLNHSGGVAGLAASPPWDS